VLTRCTAAPKTPPGFSRNNFLPTISIATSLCTIQHPPFDPPPNYLFCASSSTPCPEIARPISPPYFLLAVPFSPWPSHNTLSAGAIIPLGTTFLVKKFFCKPPGRVLSHSYSFPLFVLSSCLTSLQLLLFSNLLLCHQVSFKRALPFFTIPRCSPRTVPPSLPHTQPPFHRRHIPPFFLF